MFYLCLFWNKKLNELNRNTGSIIISRLKKKEDEGNFTCLAESNVAILYCFVYILTFGNI